eukprot:gene8536-5983_t
MLMMMLVYLKLLLRICVLTTVENGLFVIAPLLVDRYNYGAYQKMKLNCVVFHARKIKGTFFVSQYLHCNSFFLLLFLSLRINSFRKIALQQNAKIRVHSK